MKTRTSYFFGRSLFYGIGLSYLFKLTKSNFWIAFLMGTILGILILYFIKNTNNNKIIKNISGIVLTIITSVILINFAHTLYLENTPLLFLTVFTLILCYIMSKCENSAITRVAQILFIYSIFSFLFEVLSLVPHVKINNIYPLFNSSILDTLWGIVVFALISTTPIIVLDSESSSKEKIINYVISMFTIFIIGFLSITVLGLKEVLIYRYPEYVVLKRIKILNFISNVDNIFSFVIIIDLILTIVQSIKNINFKSRKLEIGSLILIMLIVNYICMNNFTIMFLYNYLPFMAIFLLILILIPKK